MAPIVVTERFVGVAGVAAENDDRLDDALGVAGTTVVTFLPATLSVMAEKTDVCAKQ
jgi:hypothetical protein